MVSSLQTGRTPWARTGAFLALAAVCLLAPVWLRARPVRPSKAELGDLYCRGGDTFVRVYFLASALDMSGLRTQGLLLRSRQYYQLAGGIDPTSMRAGLSLGLVERAMGRPDVGNRTIFRALRLGSPPAEEADAIRALVLFKRPEVGSVFAARRLLGDRGPLPLLFTDVYQRMGRPDLADRQTKQAEQQGLALVPALIGLLITCGLILACGAVGLVVGAIALGRKLTRAGSRPAPPSARVAPSALLQAAWTAREAVEAIIIFVFVQMAVESAGALGFGGSDPLRRALGTILSGACAVLWVRLVSPRRVRFGWRFTRWWRQAAVGVATGGGAVLPLWGLQQLLVWLFGDNPAHDPVKALLVSPPGLPSRAAIILLVCVVVPVLEETLFRGVLYRALRGSAPGPSDAPRAAGAGRQWSFLRAALGSGLVFAAGHLTVAAFPPMLILGILLAYLYERSGSLLVPALAHGAFNAFNLAIMLAVFG